MVIMTLMDINLDDIVEFIKSYRTLFVLICVLASFGLVLLNNWLKERRDVKRVIDLLDKEISQNLNLLRDQWLTLMAEKSRLEANSFPASGNTKTTDLLTQLQVALAEKLISLPSPGWGKTIWKSQTPLLSTGSPTEGKIGKFYLNLDELDGIRSQMVYTYDDTPSKPRVRVHGILESEGYSRDMSDLWVRYSRLAEFVLEAGNPLREKG
jgi:hypothetical protein